MKKTKWSGVTAPLFSMLNATRGFNSALSNEVKEAKSSGAKCPRDFNSYSNSIVRLFIDWYWRCF